MSAATQALKDAGWKPTAYEDQIRTGVLIGSGIGGLQGIEKTSLLFAEKGPRRVSPFFIPGRLINLAAGYVSIEHGLKGPNHAVVTACSTGAHAIGDASRLVALGDADVISPERLSESPVCRLQSRVRRLPRALNSFNDQPGRPRGPMTAIATASSLGEGESWLEELGHAARVHIYARSSVTDYQATRSTSPRQPRTATGLSLHGQAVKRAPASIPPISTISTHAPRRHMGDEIDCQRSSGCSAMPRARSDVLKSAIGHLLARPARSRRSSRTGDPRRQRRPRSISTILPWDGDRSRAASGEAPDHRYGAVELVRIWRDQCLVDHAPLRCVTLPFENLPFAIFRLQVHGIVARGACWPCL